MSHNLFIQIDMTLNYIFFISDFQENIFTQASKIPYELARGARQLIRDLSSLCKDIFLEVRDEKYSLGSYLFV